jgi:hypothetical protein
LKYIAKYCFKTKIKFLKLIDVLREILSHISSFSKSSMFSFVIKMMNRLVNEHDWSTQKIYHHLLERDLK